MALFVCNLLLLLRLIVICATAIVGDTLVLLPWKLLLDTSDNDSRAKN